MVHQVVRAVRRLLAIAAVGALAGLARPVAAQTGSVSGTILDAKTERPLPDATVAIVGTQITARSGTRGEFRLTGASGASVQLTVTRIGYQQAKATATVDGAAIRVFMNPLVVKLDELVVTGTTGEQQQRTLGNAIGRVAVSDNIVVAPPAKLQDLLSVNVPGVRVINASGEVGAGGTTRIRGSASLSLSNEPLVYVDGVRVNNTGAAPSAAFQGWSSPSRINDLNPEEIESIEVLKGPSAATIYGTEASNGVIQIITKRGRAGRPTIEVHSDVGANWLKNPEGRYPANYYIGRDGAVHEFNVLRFRDSTGLPAIFSTGRPVGVGGSISGGNDQLRYYFSGDFNRDVGYLDYNWQNKYSGRANLSYSTTNNKFKVDVSLGTLRSKARSAQGVQAMTTSIIWACNFPGCEPSANDPANSGWNVGGGFQFYRPEDYSHVFAYDNIDRTTFSLRLTHTPFTWLRQHLTVGPDFTNARASNLVERAPGPYVWFFNTGQGYKADQQLRSTYMTLDYGASADWNVSKNLIATTSVGAQYYYKQHDQLYATGQVFAVPGPSDITGAAQIAAQEAFQENKTLGVYGQEQLSYKNRLFLTGALRADDNSAFGANFNAAYYPKFSLSWVASDEPFLAHSKVVSALKFRGAWGKAGEQPDIFSAIRTYQPKVGSGGLGEVTPQNIGNQNLKPEVAQEIEAGFDAGLFNQRLGIEFTFYRKDVKDAIVSEPNKPSRGFPGFTFLNIGKTRNQGIEIALDGTPISGRNVSLDLRFTLATNDAKILSLGGSPAAFVGESFIQQWNVEGFSAGSFFYKKVVSSTVNKVNVGGIQLPVGFDPQCEGGTDLGYGNGTVVACADAPRIYAGRPTPSWNGSFSATLTLGRRLRILGLVDYLGGGMTMVGDVAAINAFFWSGKQLLEGSNSALSGYLGEELLYGDSNIIGATGLFKNGFAKLRTISATYELPTSVARWVGASRGSISIAGDNLITLWRAQSELYGVKWIDSEISANFPNQPGAGGDYGYVQESLPQAARIRTTIRLTF
jgi:TonB-dependent SusC/RagA subfamily outer membrane receptor